MHAAATWLGISIVALAASFLGFSQCGSYLWLNRSILVVVLIVVLAVLAVRSHLNRGLSTRQRLLSACVFGVAAYAVYELGFRVGAFLYTSPSSWAEVLDPSC